MIIRGHQERWKQFLFNLVPLFLLIFYPGIKFNIFVTNLFPLYGIQMNLVDWFKGMVSSRRGEEALDPRIQVQPSPRALKRALLVCLRCIDLDTEKRPKMGQIVHMLEADEFPFRSVSPFPMSYSSNSVVFQRPKITWESHVIQRPKIHWNTSTNKSAYIEYEGFNHTPNQSFAYLIKRKLIHIMQEPRTNKDTAPLRSHEAVTSKFPNALKETVGGDVQRSKRRWSFSAARNGIVIILLGSKLIVSRFYRCMEDGLQYLCLNKGFSCLINEMLWPLT